MYEQIETFIIRMDRSMWSYAIEEHLAMWSNHMEPLSNCAANLKLTFKAMHNDEI